MAIRKLLTDSHSDAKFFLKENEGILVFENKGIIHCLHLVSPDEAEILKIKQFEPIENLKFIGDKKVFEKVVTLCTAWKNTTRTVFINKSKEVIFHSKTGRIQFAKEEKNSISITKNVLIVDDSKTIQKLLAKIIEKSSVLKVAGIASCPSEAKAIIESKKIDLITLDIHMPEMTGVEFLKTYLGSKNIPTVMISSVSISEGPLVMEALSSGAYTYIQKPSIDQLAQVSEDILEKLEALAKGGARKKEVLSTKANIKFDNYDGLIAIGSSTGGTQALQHIFTALPDSIPPIVVVQHIPAVFSKALADRLNTLCAFTVKEAEDGELLKKDTIYIAPGGKQMKLLKRGSEKRVSITDDPPLNRFQPSVDYLFNSLPNLKEVNLIGIILTGMGKDGAKGLLELRNNGAFTIAQDEDSSIVFGMPKEAIALGAAMKIVSLQEMSINIVLEFNKLFRNKAA